jgi:hypothetical protein
MARLNRFYWEKNVVSAQAVADRVGVPFEDLYIINREIIPDLLTQLIEAEDIMITAKLTDNPNTLFDRTGIRFNEHSLKLLKQMAGDLTKINLEDLTPTGPNETITELDIKTHFTGKDTAMNEVTNAFADLEDMDAQPTHPLLKQLSQCDNAALNRFCNRLNEQLQFAYGRAVSSALWIATLLHEGRDFDYIPDVNETRNAMAIALEGVELYAFNREFEANDPGRKSLSGAQWNMLTGNTEQCVQHIQTINDLRAVGFEVESSFEDAYNAARADRIQRQRDRAAQELNREQAKKGALDRAHQQTLKNLEGIV